MGFFPESKPVHPSVEAPDNNAYSELIQVQAAGGPDAVNTVPINQPRPGYSIAGMFASGLSYYKRQYAPAGKNLNGMSFYVTVSGNELRVTTGQEGDSNAMYGGIISVWLYYQKVVTSGSQA
jgi:hypothetical protein